jgi:hypothetical protein
MNKLYLVFKKLSPKYLRTLIRNLDSAYQELLKLSVEQENVIKQQSQAIELKNEQIHQLENSIFREEDYEKLSQQGLFIVGNARSATSVLCDCLNFCS